MRRVDKAKWFVYLGQNGSKSVLRRSLDVSTEELAVAVRWPRDILRQNAMQKVKSCKKERKTRKKSRGKKKKSQADECLQSRRAAKFPFTPSPR